MSVAPSFESGSRPAEPAPPLAKALVAEPVVPLPRSQPLQDVQEFEADAGRSNVSSLIDIYLQEQRQLTAVERFSQRHTSQAEHLQARYYKELLPATAPKPGQQYAFEVDLDRCSGCKGCVSACHSLNGLDDNETWREVGFLVGKEKRPTPKGRRIPLQVETVPAIQTITTACHHCVDPGCLSGCPVLAYEKDPITGIVSHLDDQCIGCTYCVMKCPYEVPKYSPKRGIVRKCDMCQGRLAVGEAPACVQACPSVAIAIRVVDVEETRHRAEHNVFLPASPDPRITLPTTRYLTKREGLEVDAADRHRVVPQPGHGPLVALLVFTQLAAGGFIAAGLLDSTSPVRPLLAAAAWIALQIGLASSVLHLGQPLKAWRGFLGWRRSWLSRELIALSGFAGIASGLTLAVWHERLPLVSGLLAPISPLLQAVANSPLSWWLTGVAGLVGVFSSIMVYVDTHRAFWSLRETSLRFFGSSLALGTTLAWTISHLAQGSASDTLAKVLLILGTIRLLNAATLLRARPDSSLAKTVTLHLHHFGRTTLAWLVSWMVGGLLAPLAALGGHASATTCLLAFVALLMGDLLERRLFFSTVSSIKMPGGTI